MKGKKNVLMLFSSNTNCYLHLRVEAHAKATMIKEKALKDRDQYSTELKELERVIAHESTLKTFMIVKCSDAGRQDDEHEMGLGQCKRQPVCCSCYVCLY